MFTRLAASDPLTQVESHTLELLLANNYLRHLEYEIELQPGEKLTLPPALIESVGAGRWVVTVRSIVGAPIRSHGAFLYGYAADDDGLYDGDSGR